MAGRTRTRNQAEETPEVQEMPEPETNEAQENPEVEVQVEETQPVASYAALFENNKVLSDMAANYLSTSQAILNHNEKYSAKPEDGEWNPNKLLREAKSVRESDNEANSLLDTYEAALEAVSSAKARVAQHMATKLGVELSPEVPKPSDEETSELKERRKQAVELGKAMQTMATLLSDPETKSQLEGFLNSHPLPNVGSERTWNPAESGSGTGGTKKHRVDVRAEKDGTEVLSLQKGFTAAVNAVRKAKLHDRGDAPDADTFRKVWEDNGEKDTSFEYKGVTYILTTRK